MCLHTCVCVPLEDSKWVRSTGAGLTGCCEPLDVSAENQTRFSVRVASALRHWATEVMIGNHLSSSPSLPPSLSPASFHSHKAPVRRRPAWPLTDSSSLPLHFPNTRFTDYIFYHLGNSNRNGFKWQGLEIVTVFLQERVTNFTSASELIKTFWSTIILDTLSLKLGLLS